MSYVFPVEPSDGWHAGDLAYCVNDKAQGVSTPMIEKGRVYLVTASKKLGNIAHHGLKLDGIDTGDVWGFWSNKFIKLGPVGGRLKSITNAAQLTSDHYWARKAS